MWAPLFPHHSKMSASWGPRASPLTSFRLHSIVSPTGPRNRAQGGLTCKWVNGPLAEDSLGWPRTQLNLRGGLRAPQGGCQLQGPEDKSVNLAWPASKKLSKARPPS